MNLGDLRSRSRTLLYDTASPYLWADTELDYNINQAILQACMRAHLLRGSSDIPIVVGQSIYEFPIEKIDQLISARITNEPPLDVVSLDWLEENYWNLTDTGTPVYIAKDDDSQVSRFPSYRLYPTPSSASTMTIRYTRLPGTLSDNAQTPEIGSEYHDSLINYVLYLAYSKYGVDTYAPEKAAACLDRFTQDFGLLVPADVRQHRRRRANMTVIPK